jgi:hypothetical protein
MHGGPCRNRNNPCRQWAFPGDNQPRSVFEDAQQTRDGRSEIGRWTGRWIFGSTLYVSIKKTSRAKWSGASHRWYLQGGYTCPYLNTELAFNRLDETLKKVDQLPKGQTFANYGQLAEIARRLVDDNIPEHLDIYLEQATREGLKEIISRAWWRRTWIPREVAAYDNPTFFCGDFAISKNAFLRYQQLASISALNSGADDIARRASREYSSVSMALNIVEG